MRRAPLTPADVRVVHRDAHLLVVHKPPGIPTTSPSDDELALTHLVARLDPEAPRLHATSRLDAEVSGLVTFARTRDANAALLAARREGTYRRLYLALVAKAPTPPEGRWQAALAIDPRDARRRVVVEDPGALPAERRAREAATRYEVRAVAPAAALLALHPETGRTHQLRVHAAHAGSPLFGDVMYGGERRLVRDNGRVVTARRVMLHCAALTLPDVQRRGEVLRIVSPVTDDFSAAWVGSGGELGALN